MATEPTTETKTDTTLKLDPPEALNPIAPAEAAGLVPLKAEETTELDKRVAQFVAELAALDSNSPEFGKKVDQLTAMGRKEISEAAGASNRFLDRPVKAIDKDTGIGADLTELRRTVESLDPKEATKTRKLLGIIPFGNSVDRYFDKYRSSQTHISKILGSLANGKDELLMDNAAIDTERAGLWKTMHKLEQMVHISKSLDKQLEEKANELDATDPAKAKAIRESALFYTRQRTTDLLTQTAVTVQGYLALDLVKKNNVELVKGVDRASTTTVSALRTAVTVAQAMTNQKLVLQQITALNTTTAGMIDSTGEMLRTQTGAIHEQAASSTIPIETLQRAFQNIYETMDQIDRFKLQALDNMKQTVNTLSSEVEKSKGYIARAEGVNQAKLEGAPRRSRPLKANEHRTLRQGHRTR
ncbi:toxic anion resistance protein [Sphingomonas sediminicola]|uniref:Toxic anion resistance protein n=1 Tax=Sphingomonas sediminicola TaxID=386874 RepID=A0ABX6TCR0_9SPHN|nr:toxic anion resistance protein [Sphingomonas sediminicola]QNP46538.1 toxic anion resistance protein [Sphingomonas sediminicola]